MKRLVVLCLAIHAMAVSAAPMPPREQRRVAEAAARLIETRYVDARAGRTIAAKLRGARDLWRAPAEPEVFAKRMTRWLRDAASDGHFAVDYSAKPLPADGGEAAFSAAELDRYYGPQLNHGVEKVERLEGNIMLLDLRVFPPPAMATDVIAAAMTLVAQGDALIIDLRRNGGGMDTVSQIAAQLLPPGSPMSGTYDRPSDTLSRQLSAAPPPGRRFGDAKPVFVLTSKRTFSAAEALAYDLQALKRATIVGEVTGGGANPFEYRRIDDHFALSLPEARSVNPITGTNWQNVGVKPDVPVPADQALAKAIELARAAVAARK